MKKSILLFAFILLVSGAMAQRFTIIGKIKDATTLSPIAYANMVIVSAKDTNKTITGTSTDSEGKFVIKKLKRQKLVLKASYVGYLPLNKELNLLDIKNDTLFLDNILINPNSSSLSEVTIEAKVNRIVVDEDKLTMNVDEKLAATVTNAFDLLKKVPGVFIDKDDNMTLNGKSGVAFQYNGRELKLEWEAIVDMLKGMAPDQVEKFEVMTNPGVKYDAEGTAGIINIKLKKNKNYGINGSVSARSSYHTLFTYGGSARINYVDDRWTTSLGYSRNQWASSYESRSERYTSKQEGDTTLFRNQGKSEWNSINNNIDLSANYLIDTTRTLGMSLYYSNGGSPWIENVSPYLISSYPNYFSEIDSSYTNKNGRKSNRNNFSIGFDYVKKLDTNDAKISADINFSYNSSNSSSLSENKYFLGNIDNYLLRKDAYKTSTNSPSENLSFRVDYYKPFNKSTRLEAGFKSGFNFSDVDYSALTLDTSGNYANDISKSNRFKYFENINSLYASFSKKFKKKTDIRIGIRLEQTNTQGYQFILDSTIKRSYFNIFPNLRASYSFSDDNKLSLTYSYRISRPWSSSLNPFINKGSDYYYSTGNPNINPQYSQSISLSHSWKYMLFTDISYSFTKDDINYLSTPINDTTGVINPLALMSSPVNFGNSQNLSFSMSFNKDFFEWWSFYVYAGADYDKIKSASSTTIINREFWSYSIRINTSFTLPKKWDFGISYYYSSGSIWGISKSSGYQDVNISLGKRLFKENLSIYASVSGLLNLDKNYRETVYSNTISKSWSKYQGPSFSLSIRYKFGKYYQNKQVSKPQVESFDDRAGQSK